MIVRGLISVGRPVQAFWLRRSVHERKLLGVAGIFLLLFALFMLFGWVHGERRRLKQALPLAQARLAQMQMAAEEHVRLQAQPIPARLVASALTDALRAGASAHGLSSTIELTSEGALVRGLGAFDALITWLADVQRDQALRPQRLEVSRDGNIARFEVMLVYPEPQ